MRPADRALAERVHATITASAPELAPQTWSGMPAYTNSDGEVVVAFKDSGKLNTRYSSLEFLDPANLDAGDIWPVFIRHPEVEPYGREEDRRASEGRGVLTAGRLASAQSATPARSQPNAGSSRSPIHVSQQVPESSPTD